MLSEFLILFACVHLLLWSVVAFYAHKYRNLVAIIYPILRNMDMSTIFSNKNEAIGEATLLSSGKSLRIPYTYMKRSYVLHVPYSRAILSKMTNVIMMTENEGKTETFKQQPGIPILVHANQLGVEKFLIYSDDLNTANVYSGDTPIHI